MEIIAKLEKFINQPVPQVVLLLGGIFVITSITFGRYITLSFSTFFYGIVSTYLRIIRKDDKIGYWPYFVLQVILLVLWISFLVLKESILLVQ